MRMLVKKNHGIKDQITTARLIKYLLKYVFISIPFFHFCELYLFLYLVDQCCFCVVRKSDEDVEDLDEDVYCSI